MPDRAPPWLSSAAESIYGWLNSYLMVVQCVGLHSSPFAASLRQNSQAMSRSCSLNSIAPIKPRDLTSFTCLLLRSSSSLYCIRDPSVAELSIILSSISTSSDFFASAAAIGFPPYVEPCSPGLICSITASSASTAETG